jgi:hypothetical protein
LLNKGIGGGGGGVVVVLSTDSLMSFPIAVFVAATAVLMIR